MLVHAREDEDDVDLRVVDHGLRACELSVDAVVGGCATALAVVDVVHGAHVDTAGRREGGDHAPIRAGEDAAAADHAEAEAHDGPLATR